MPRVPRDDRPHHDQSGVSRPVEDRNPPDPAHPRRRRGHVADQNRPTLSLSFKDALGGLITDVRPTQTRLPVFFANLLPEGAMRDYLALRGGLKPEREFFLIAMLGQDLPGALEIRAADSAPPFDEYTLDTVRETVMRFAEVWRNPPAGIIDDRIRAAIERHIQSVPIWNRKP